MASAAVREPRACLAPGEMVWFGAMSPISRDDPQESAIDEYLDCTGKKRFFRLSLYARRNFLDAIELRDGEPIGWRFVLPVERGGEPPWGEMRDRIREHLSRRDIVRDTEGRLQLLHRLIRAQISETDEATEPKLSLLVDDLELPW
ncbi:MAG: hypothetical protein ACREQ9_13175, partial [Candidatus Binatia bacterium]